MTIRGRATATKRQTTSRLLFSSPWMQLREDVFERCDGSSGLFAVVSRSDFVVAVGEVEGGLIMTEQYRYAARRWSLELPQGGIEDNETAEQAALRELREETGWIAEHAEVIGARIYEAADWATQKFSVVLVDPMRRGISSLDHDELGASDHIVPWEALPALIAAERIIDATTLAALGLYRAVGNSSSGVSPGISLNTETD